jgi:hypothetical protein
MGNVTLLQLRVPQAFERSVKLEGFLCDITVYSDASNSQPTKRRVDHSTTDQCVLCNAKFLLIIQHAG